MEEISKLINDGSAQGEGLEGILITVSGNDEARKSGIDFVPQIAEYAGYEFNREDIAELTGLGYHRVCLLIRSNNIKVVRKKNPTRKRPEIDDLLTGEYHLREIAAKVGPRFRKRGSKENLSHEGVRNYIISTNQFESYNKKRRDWKISHSASGPYKRESYRNLAHVLAKIVIKRAGEESWALSQALAYEFLRLEKFSNENSLNVPRSKLIHLFEIYGRAKEAGEKIGLGKLGSQSGIYEMTARGIMKTMNLQPLCDSHVQVATPKEKKDAILRAYRSDTSPSDIAYFLELPYHTVLQLMRRYCGRLSERSVKMISIEEKGITRHINYRVASEIFLAKDAGYTDMEIISEFGRKNTVMHILSNRTTLEPHIIKTLNFLYQGREFEKPYL